MSAREEYEKWKNEGPVLALAELYEEAVTAAKYDPSPENLAIMHNLGEELSEMRSEIRRAGRRIPSVTPRPEPEPEPKPAKKRGFWATLFSPYKDAGGEE